MKGHVGDGACSRGFRARGGSIVVTFTCPYVTIRLDMCRVMTPELILRQEAGLYGSSCCEIGPKLESLILAQNERWRHA